MQAIKKITGLFCILFFLPMLFYGQPVKPVNPNYSLPQVMIRLSNIAYITDNTNNKQVVIDSLNHIVPNQELVWGPQMLADIFGVTYSAMYVVKEKNTDNYTVVIRGTNAFSLKSWIGEDFEVSKTDRFSRFVKAAPADACISRGTCHGMRDLIRLREPGSSGQNVVDFLKTKTIKALYVTGHSLGGTLTPPFYAYLCYKLFGGPAPAGISSNAYSFAGLTAGNQAFNNYLQLYLPDASKPWRFVNPYDVAPKCWGNFDALKNIYSSQQLVYGTPESELFGYLFNRAAPNNYAQPDFGQLVLPAVFNPCNMAWVLQGSYQHHSTTYISLIDSCCSK